MNYGTSILGRRNVRAYAAAFVSYLLLAGQVAPLALGAAPRPLPAAAATTATAPAKAAPQPAPVVFAAPVIVATKVDAFPVHPSGKAEPGDVVSYTVTISNTGDMDATGVTFTDNVDTNTTLNAGSVNTQPITDPDTYPASGNIPISLAAPGVLTNDRDPDTGNNTNLTVTKVGPNVGSLNAANVGVAMDTTATGRSAVKGSVNLAANGGFTYEPPPGFEGADTFSYEASDGTSTDTQTVTINVGGASGMVWFIQNNAGGSNRGTFSQPFTSIASFNTANAGTGAVPDPKNGDFIALRTGSGTYSEADGINLRAQQKVIGNGVAFNSSFTAAANSSSAYTTFAGSAGSAPNIVATAGNGVDLAADNTLRGFNVGNTSGFDINGGAVGAPVINNVNLSGTGGAINVSTSGAFGANVTFGEFSSTSSTGANVNLVGVTGTLGITSTTGGLSGSAAASPAVNVSGGSVSFTVPSGGGSVAKSSGTGAAVSVAGAHAGTLTFNATVSATSGTGLQFSDSDGTYNFNGTTTMNGGDAGIDITNGSGGTFNFSASTSIASPTGAAFNVASSPGAPNVTYSGTITHNTAGQRAVNIDGTTGGSIVINSVTAGSVAGGVANTGVNINNAAGSVTFTTLNLGTSGTRMTQTAVTIAGGAGTKSLGTVAIFTTGGALGINATTSTGAISNTTGTINTAGAAAANIVGTSAASRTPLNLQFTRIDTTGGSNGIVLQNTSQTGSPGGFNVLGTTAGNCGGVASPGSVSGTTPDTADCTGGQIQTTTGATAGSSQTATIGVGILLTDVDKVSLTRLRVNGHSNFGLKGLRVSNATLTSSYFHNNGDDVGGEGEGNVYFFELTAAGAVTNCYLDLGAARNLEVLNTSGTLDRLTVSGTTIGNDGANGSDGIFLQADNSATSVATTLKATVQNSRFLGSAGDGIQFSVRGSSVCDFVFTGNRMRNNHPSPTPQNFAVAVSAGGNTGYNPTITYNISNNNISQVGSTAISVGKGGVSSDGSFVGTIANNTIGEAAVANSGSAQGSAIVVDIVGGGVHNSTITGNTIRQFTNYGIFALSGNKTAGGGTGNLLVDIRGNNIATPSPASAAALFPTSGIRVQTGTNAGDDHNNCVIIGGSAAADKNVVTGTGTNGGSDLRLFQRFQTRLSVPGYAGANNNDAAMEAFLLANNTAGTADASNNTAAAPAGPGYSGSCAGIPTSGPETSDAGSGGTGIETDAASRQAPKAGTKARPAALPRATTTTAPAAAAPVSAAPKAVKAEAKRSAGTTFRHTAEDSSAPLNAEPTAQRRKVSAPVLTNDKPGGPNGAGGTVSVNIGTLRQGDSVTITFSVTIDNPYGGGPNISNQGTVSGSNFSNVLTNDPGTGAPNDPTLTPVNSTDIRINDATAAEPSTGTAQMLFTVTLTQPAPAAGVTVTYNTANGTATGGASCGGTVDYVTVAGGTATVPSGSQTATIPVTVCADSDSPESSETLTVTISAPSSGNIVDNVATGTITQGTTAGTFVISEIRTSGPGGLGDDFVEFYNNTDSPLTVAASDASAGYGVYKMGASCNDTPVLIATIPNGTVIPARGHYLAVGSQYTLANYGGTGAAAGNVTLTSDIESDRNVAVFTTATVGNISSANRHDAVGFGGNTGAVCDLLREGTNLGATAGSTTEHAFFRTECGFAGGCTSAGNPKDTNNNAADFVFADTQGTNISGIPQKLGAPGPENLSSPIRRDTSGIGLALLDGSKATSAVPNRSRSFTSDAGNNSTFGTLTIRRRVVNNTGGPVTRLRFRIIEMTTFPSPGGGVADLRARTGVVEAGIGPVGDATTCTASGAGSPPCNVTVQATTLETPPSQPNGGGINSTLAAGTITTGSPLANGASLNVNFLLGIQTTGTFRFLIIIEALP
jgi:hypothetical protein